MRGRACARRSQCKVRIAAIVFIETVWMLQKRIHASRADVAHTARELLEHPHYRVEDAESFRLEGVRDAAGRLEAVTRQ
jgi:predicted nucleic-acid-binding protein